MPGKPLWAKGQAQLPKDHEATKRKRRAKNKAARKARKRAR